MLRTATTAPSRSGSYSPVASPWLAVEKRTRTLGPDVREGKTGGLTLPPVPAGWYLRADEPAARSISLAEGETEGP